MKKTITCLLVIALLATMVPWSVFAATEVAAGTCGDGITWSLDEGGVLTLTGSGSMGADRPWYDYRNQIYSVVIGKGITDIGAYAFARMKVASVTIPDTVTKIGAGAFFGTALTEVKISANVTDIGYGAFSACGSLKAITVASGNKNYRSENGLLYQGNTLIRVPAAVTAVTLETLPEIAVDAFRGVNATVTAPEIPHKNYGGNLTWVEAPKAKVPTLAAQYCSVSFEGAIQLNVYYAAENVENAVEMGLLTFNRYPEVGDFTDAVDVIAGYVSDGSQYMVHTNGIPAKNLGDTVYFRIYAKMADGSYVYSAINNYSPQTYAEGRLNNSDPTVVALVRSMLDYGASAQSFFGYRTETLMNACLDKAGHQYGEVWTAERPATLTLGGTEYRKCSICGGGKQSRLTDKLTVASIAVTTPAQKLSYHAGEEFQPKGMVVTATLSDGSKLEVTDYQCALSGSTVTVTYGAVTTRFTVTLQEPALISVSDIDKAANGTALYVEGLYVGVAEEGASSDKEVLIKDMKTDAIIAVRNVPYGIFPEYGYEYGDQIRILATVQLDGTSNTPNKRYLDFSAHNGNIQSTIVSVGNSVEYALTDTVKVESWAQMQQLFAVGAISEYTYVEITAPLYVNRYDGSDGIDVCRIHANGAATGVSGIRTDGKRTVSLRDNVMERNLGADWMSLFFDSVPEAGSYPGYALPGGSLIALYTGANGYYYQLTVLDESWVALDEYDNNSVVIEVANAYLRQGNQIQYDQTQSRRNINASPEEAAAANTLYMDCSSYVNAVYFEAFGVNAMPYALEDTRPSTAAYTTYVQENVGVAVDAIGYWENADYTTAAQISGILSEVRNQLQVGDLLVYRHGETGPTSGHVYIYLGDNTFNHCTGSSFVYGSTPSASYDKATSNEKTIGAVQSISGDDIFTNTSNTRYLFKQTASDSVYNFCILRPMARQLTPTEESKKRMKIKGVDMEKSVSHVAACPGDAISYTVTLTNCDSLDRMVQLEELLGENVSFVSGAAGMVCENGKLTWSGVVAAGTTVTVTYTVRVGGGNLVTSRTYVNGVELDVLNTTVSGYTTQQLIAVATLAKQYASNGKTFANPLDFAQSLYRETLGIEPFGSYTAMTLLSSLIDTKNDTCYASPILVPNLYGGMDIRSGFIYDNQRTRLIRPENLAVGDVIVAEYGGVSDVFVYVGQGQLVQVNSADGVCKLVTSSGNIYASDDIFVTFTAYDRFAVLRPSMG